MKRQFIFRKALFCMLISVLYFSTLRAIAVAPPQTSLTKRPVAAVAQQSNPARPPSVSRPTASTPSRTPTPQPAAERVSDQTIITTSGQRLPLRTYTPLLVPNDPKAVQWWTDNARFEAAWDIPRGSNDTLLAIIDTGFSLNHEEFKNRWFINSAESGPATTEQASQLNCADRGLALNANCNLIDDDYDGLVDNESGLADYQNPSRLNCTDQGKPLTRDCNQIDDDGNGLIDDVRGWDFINFDNSAQAGELNSSGSGTHHGTYVTGAAAATGNNGRGLAGADWGTKILPIQALDDDSYGNSLSVARAIRYAASLGADVISLSLGSQLPDDYVRAAIGDATKAGSIVVAASGNDGCECIIYPANYPEVVAVGALDTNNQPAAFSSWGENLDILAPGVGFYTTDWTPANPTNAYADGISGTSLATPLVSGLLTRLLSHQPQMSPLQTIAALTENTNRLTLSPSLPHSPSLGFGVLDAGKAAQRTITPLSSLQLHTFTPVSSGNSISPISPAERVTRPLSAYQCLPPTVATTPIFELLKNGVTTFSVSHAETAQAVQSGYAATLFAYGCLQLPHDQVPIIRNLNLFSEFKNTSPKF